MIRIAYVVSEYPSPSHTFIRREIAALQRRGARILPVSIRDTRQVTQDLVPSVLGQPFLRLFILALRSAIRSPLMFMRVWLLALRHRPAGLRGLIWAQFHFVEALVLSEMLRQRSITRVHSHFANAGATVAMLAAHHLGLPWTISLHGISELDGPSGPLLKEKIARAETVFCASWFMRAQGMRTVPTELWTKFQIVRCGVELAQLPTLATAKEGPRGIRYLTVARLSSEKGYPGLIRAFNDLVVEGVDAELVIVGDGPLRISLEETVQAGGLTDRVSFLGALSEQDTLEQISRTDVFVLPSLMEGLPVVLMEAMALERATIAPQLAGIPELIRDKETGLLFHPADWDALFECMLKLANDLTLRGAIGKAGRKVVEEDYNIDRVIEPLVSSFGFSLRESGPASTSS